MMMSSMRARFAVHACLRLFVFAMLFAPLAALAQPEALPTPQFKMWTSGAVNVVARMPDGGLLVGGAFTAIDGVPRQNLARLLPSGSLDPAFDPQPNGTVTAIAVDGDGTIYVAGIFNSIGGANRQRIAKLAVDGALDVAWDPSVGGTVNALALDGSGSIFVAGDFSAIAGSARNHVAKLGTGGTGVADPAWHPEANGVVQAIAYDAAAGKVYIGGGFTSVGVDARAFVARMDGIGDGAADSWNPGAGGRVYALQFDGSWLYAGGNFQSFGGQAHELLARVSASGDVDASWTPAATSGGGVVQSLALGSGALYIAGSFALVNGAPQAGVARVSTLDAGSLDGAFAPVVNDAINHVATFGDGIVHIASSQLSYVSGNVRLGMAALDAVGTPLPTAYVMSPGTISALIPLADGSTLAGGDFYFADDAQHSNLLKFDADGVVDPSWTASTEFRVNLMTIDASATSLYVAGDFTRAQGQDRRWLAKFGIDGVLDPAWNPMPDYSVYGLTAAPDGAIYVGGNFQNIAGTPRNRIAKLSGADGSVVDGWNTQGADGPVGRFMIAPDGSVFVVGSFNLINGQARRGIAKLDPVSGVADATWSADLGAFEYANRLLFRDGSIYVGGGFSEIGGVPRSKLAKLSIASPAIVDAKWTPEPNGDVEAMTFGLDDQMFIGGSFTTLSGQTHRKLAKLSTQAGGAVDANWVPDITLSGSLVNSLVINAAGDLLVGGYYESLGGHPRQGIGALPQAISAELFADGFE
jgi:hypothetical protein